MISFRYHIVSIVSVFLALAVGVALGGGPLRDEVDNTLVDQVRADREAKAELQAEIASLRSQLAFSDSFSDTIAPGLVGRILRDRAVVLAVLPSAPRAEVARLEQMVATAGGTVSGTVQVADGLLDTENRQLVEGLSEELLESLPDLGVPADASGYEQAGALLARAVATAEDPAGARVDDEANRILSGFEGAELMTVDGELARRGSLVLFVAGSPSGTPEEVAGRNSIVTTLVRSVDENTDGVVVAGTVAAARPGGVVEAVRQDVGTAQDVSSVDVLGRSAGRVVAMMALAGQAQGQTGHYGVVDAADGAMPGAGGEGVPGE